MTKQNCEFDITIIDFNKTRYFPQQLNLFWNWLWWNYREETQSAFTRKDRAEQIIKSVTTNPARAKDNMHEKTKQQTISRVYYEVCFSRRGPHWREHVHAKDDLRDLHKKVQNMYDQWKLSH